MKQMPQRVKDRIDKLTGELKRIYELAEQNWEGCQGCDENDKYFWMNGFQTGYNVKSAEQQYTEKDMRAAFQAGKRYGKSEGKPYRTMYWEQFIQVYNETLETVDKNK
jgi:hypothetical protein